MTFIILIDGKPFPPDRALRERMPLDTSFRCPSCDGGPVSARAAKTTVRLPGEAQRFVPRMQDRKCESCKHEWQCVLPPEVYHDPEFQKQNR